MSPAEFFEQYFSDLISGERTRYPLLFSRLWYDETLDTWASRERWIAVGKEMLARRQTLDGLSILLDQGLKEYRPQAETLIEEWYRDGGDYDYYLRLMSYLYPENPIAREFLSPDSLKRDGINGTEGFNGCSNSGDYDHYSCLLRIGDAVAKESLAGIIHQKIFDEYWLGHLQYVVSHLLLFFPEDPNRLLGEKDCTRLGEYIPQYLPYIESQSPDVSQLRAYKFDQFERLRVLQLAITLNALDLFERHHNLDQLLSFVSSVDCQDELKVFIAGEADLLAGTLLLLSRTESIPVTRLGDICSSFENFSFVRGVWDDRDQFTLRMAGAITLSRIEGAERRRL